MVRIGSYGLLPAADPPDWLTGANLAAPSLAPNAS